MDAFIEKSRQIVVGELQVIAGDTAIIVHLKLIKRNQYRTCSSKQSMQGQSGEQGRLFVYAWMRDRVCVCVCVCVSLHRLL